MTSTSNLVTKEVVTKLQSELSLTNPMEVPRITKVTLNMGVGTAVTDRKEMQSALQMLQTIAGQKPIVCNARVSVASFKIRAGMQVGCKVTLRKSRMNDFIQRLIGVVLPRQRDFRGLRPQSFDGNGNFNLGIRDQIMFPEIDYDSIDKTRGLDICITTNTNDNTKGLALLKALGFPFRT